jgi:hypothetical protein
MRARRQCQKDRGQRCRRQSGSAKDNAPAAGRDGFITTDVFPIEISHSSSRFH